MSVYTAKSLKTGLTASAEFQARGLEMTSGTASSLLPVGAPAYRQLAYQNYVSNLPAFMKATVENKRIPIVSYGYTFPMKIDDMLPISLPPLQLRFASSSQAQEDWVKKYDGMYYKEGAEGIAKFASPTAEFLKEIRHSPLANISKCRTSRGYSNVDAMQGYLTVMKIVSAFCKTQVYPAFLRNDSTVPLREEIEGFVQAKRVQPFGETGRKMKVLRMDEGDGARMAVDEREEEVDDEMGISTYKFGTAAKAEESIPYARASETSPFYFMTGQTLPSGDGLSFPYFDTLLEDDYTFVPSTIWQFFSMSLGTSKDTIVSAYKAVKGSHGMWAMTPQGRILQHLLIGVKLAIECQARLIPVFLSKGYSGFVLLGGRFKISIAQREYLPVSGTELVREIASIDLHTTAVQKILDILAELTLEDEDDEYMAITSPDDVRGARHLRELVQERVRGADDNKRIEDLTADLAFPETYYEFTVEHIKEIFDLSLKEESVDSTAPLFSRGGAITTNSTIFANFSVFGELAPSFRHSQGKILQIPKSVGEDTLFDIPKGKKGPTIQSIVVCKVPILDAVNDFFTVKRERAITNKVERSSEFRSKKFNGEQAKEMWHALIEIFEGVGQDEVDIVVGRGKKKDTGVVGESRVSDAFDDFF